jgi:hypothetical protein
MAIIPLVFPFYFGFNYIQYDEDGECSADIYEHVFAGRMPAGGK